MVLKDRFGRSLVNLRVSVTQRCNLRCPYCHREGEEKRVGDAVVEMSVDEIVRLVRIAVSLGINHVKITGGEPLLRPEILSIVKNISVLEGLKDLSMTTNGTLLAPLARHLHNYGLKRLNVNIPTLDSGTYRNLTGGDLRTVLDGIGEAVDSGLRPVKLNMLVLRGVNDGEVWRMADFAKETGTVLQLIELEPINVSEEYFDEYHVALDVVEEELKAKAVSIKSREFMQNRRVYSLPDGVVVEAIRPIENTEFCLHCARLRVTSDGKLKPCLMRKDNLVDVLTPMRRGADDEEIAGLFRLVCQLREPYYRA
jgi:cyclic pyranopterin phosphate synthase